MTLNPSSGVNQSRIDEYKKRCRRDIGFKVKKEKKVATQTAQPVQQYFQPEQRSIYPTQASNDELLQQTELKKAGRPRKDV